ncbi:retrovirus-related pol polyprotein from transposon TNT 1-94 [Tanacetum coccineum]
MLLAQLQEAGIQLSKDQLVILAVTRERINFGPGAFTVTTNAFFQVDGVEVYDLDCDDLPNTQPSFMANISSSGSYVLSEGRQISVAAGTTRTYTPGVSRSNSGKQRTVICYNCKGEGHMSKQCTKPKRKQDDSWFNDKVLLVQAQANGQILHEEELAFLADPGIAEGQANKVEVPKELPKGSMVNTSLKKLKNHLAGFDMVVKEITTITAITKGTRGFEHTKACFRDEIILFVKALKDIFNKFDQDLIDELTEVQTIFYQME